MPSCKETGKKQGFSGLIDWRSLAYVNGEKTVSLEDRVIKF